MTLQRSTTRKLLLLLAAALVPFVLYHAYEFAQGFWQGFTQGLRP